MSERYGRSCVGPLTIVLELKYMNSVLPSGLTAVLIPPLAIKFGKSVSPGFKYSKFEPGAAVGVISWPLVTKIGLLLAVSLC